MDAITINDLEREGSAARFTLPYLAGNGVVSGCAVTPADGGEGAYHLSVAEGVVTVQGRTVNVPAQEVTLISENNGDRRLDLVAVDRDGHAVIIGGGSALVNASYPSIPPAHVALAGVLVQGCQPPLPALRDVDIADKRELP